MKDKNPGGRPPLPYEQRKADRINLRITEGERNFIRQVGMSCKDMRDAILREAKRRHRKMVTS